MDLKHFTSAKRCGWQLLLEGGGWRDCELGLYFFQNGASVGWACIIIVDGVYVVSKVTCVPQLLSWRAGLQKYVKEERGCEEGPRGYITYVGS